MTSAGKLSLAQILATSFCHRRRKAGTSHLHLLYLYLLLPRIT